MTFFKADVVFEDDQDFRQMLFAFLPTKAGFFNAISRFSPVSSSMSSADKALLIVLKNCRWLGKSPSREPVPTHQPDQNFNAIP